MLEEVVCGFHAIVICSYQIGLDTDRNTKVDIFNLAVSKRRVALDMYIHVANVYKKEQHPC